MKDARCKRQEARGERREARSQKPEESCFWFIASNFLFLTSCFLLLISCSGPADNQSIKNASSGEEKTPAVFQKGDSERGRILYEKYCFYCHGRTGRGDGAVAIAVSPHPADFISDSKRMAKSDEELLKSIEDGIQRETGGEEMAMPRWKEILTEQERRDVLAYIRLLAKKAEAGGKR